MTRGAKVVRGMAYKKHTVYIPEGTKEKRIDTPLSPDAFIAPRFVAWWWENFQNDLSGVSGQFQNQRIDQEFFITPRKVE